MNFFFKLKAEKIPFIPDNVQIFVFKDALNDLVRPDV